MIFIAAEPAIRIACFLAAAGKASALVAGIPAPHMCAVVLAGINYVTARRWFRPDPVPAPGTGY